MRYVLLCLCGLMFVPMVQAESVAAMQKRTEASMVVTGFVDIAPDGTLASIILDHPERLPGEVKALVSRVSARWRFEPDPGEEPSTRHLPVSLRIVARTEGDGVYRSRIRGATFGALTLKNQIHIKSYVEPKYPWFAYENHISGDVYLLLRVDAHGDVTDVSADQVNLDTVADKQLMEQIRKLFTDACVGVARHWTFEVLQPGTAGDGAWVIRFPIHFGLMNRLDGPLQHYGQWSVYVPGPLTPVPWLQKYGIKQPTGNADAMPDGQLQLMQSQVALVTPLDDG